MGLRNWRRDRRMTDPVPGNYRLTWCSDRPVPPLTGPLRCTGTVQAFGMAPVEVAHECPAPADRWPTAGQTLPVVVDRLHPDRLRITWAEVPPPPPPEPEPEPEPEPRPGPVHPKSGRPAPGTPGGGTTPRQAAKAQSSGAYRKTTAVVLGVTDVPVRSRRAAGGAADLTLGFRLDDEDRTATVRIGFRSAERRAQVAVPGNELPVLVHPKNPGKVVVDVKEFDAWHRT
jgi:hypothetical protein